MKKVYEALAGRVNLEDATEHRNLNFGYTLFEEVTDPANPEGPKAIIMHVPPHSLSKVWELVEPSYNERVELLRGSACLVVNRFCTDDWTTAFLDNDKSNG